METIRLAYKNEQWDIVKKESDKLLSSKTSKDQDRQETYLILGSALRRQEKLQEAIKVLEKGIREYPDQAGLYHNLGNCLRSQKSENKWPIIHNYLKAQELGLKKSTLVISLARTYQDLSLSALAYKTIFTWLKAKPSNETTPVEAVMLLMELAGVVLEEPDSKRVGTWCIENLGELAKSSREGQASLAVWKAKVGHTQEAKKWFEKARNSLIAEEENDLMGINGKKKEINNEQSLINSGWNLACTLLKKGDMEGWNYYEYGLQTPAPGLQRWQRALSKPYDASEVDIWCGDHLDNRRLLILGEQAIGDSMMFLQLLPELQKETSNIVLLLPDRLVPIYKRTYPDFEIYSDDELDKLKNTEKLDLQIPCGSLPRFRLRQWLESDWSQKKLIASSQKTKKLRNKYRDGLADDQPLIGISWSGGGKASRIRAKSLTTEQFKDVFKYFPGARFVSLQYGKAEHTVNNWKHAGFDTIYDREINALTDMDTWLSQVDACDAVISVANTTIHGAGSIQKPTFCLQSRNSDWRWVDGLDHSYWYETVNTSWQSRDGSWHDAVKRSRSWFEDQKDNETNKNLILESVLQKTNFSNS